MYIKIFCKCNKWFKKLTVNYTFTLGHYVGSNKNYNNNSRYEFPLNFFFY